MSSIRTISSSVWCSLCLANFLVSMLGLIMLGGGVWIVLDYQDSQEIKHEMMEDGEDKIPDDVKITFENFYSVFSKEGGWLNFGCVSIGIGAVTFAVSFFGFCGVHKKSACLLFTYITLVIIGMILQVGAAVIIYNRCHEMKTISQMMDTESVIKLSSGKHYEKIFFFLFSGCFSTVVIVLMIVLSVMVRQAKTEGFKHLTPV